MKQLNPWVGYLDRSYQQIKNSILSKLGIRTPEITDHSESNPLVVILSFFAGIAEMLGYYIDNLARESFLESARKPESIVYLAKQLDYRVKAISPAGIDIVANFFDEEDNPVNLAAPITIAQNTALIIAGYKFITYKSATLPAGESIMLIPAIQAELVGNTSLGFSDNQPYQRYSLGPSYVNSSVNVLIDSEPWTEVSTLGRSTGTAKHFVVGVESDGFAYINFGDNKFGAIPSLGSEIVVSYLISQGEAANGIPRQVDISFESTPSFVGVSRIELTNPDPASGGEDYESIRQIKARVPLSLRTLDRAVTYQDFIDILKLVPGVEDAKIKYCCGACVEAYILGKAPGIASQSLIQAASDFLCDHKILTVCSKIKSAGITPIVLSLQIKPKFRQSTSAVESEVRQAYLNAYSIENREINQAIRVSELYALMERIPTVDFGNINFLSTKPTAMPENHNRQLYLETLTLLANPQNYRYTLRYNGLGSFSLFRDNVFQANLAINTAWSDGYMNLLILPGVYQVGDGWTITSYIPNKDLEINNYTVGVITDLNLTIQVDPNLTTLNCKPACNAN